MKLHYHTFGCKVNTYDTGLLQSRLSQAQSTLSEQGPVVHVINSCAVTAEATKEAVKLARRLKAKEPNSTVVMTGCAAQVDTKAMQDQPSIDLLVANSHKGELRSLLDRYFKGELAERSFKSSIFRKEDLEAGGGLEEGHSRAFVKIQDGCNSFCSFCIIPYARGKSRSIPIQELVQRVRELEVGEVVLTGVHIGDYEDEGRGLEDLVEELLLKTKMPRFRLTSLEPIEISDRLLALYKDSRLCPHFHMSIQSASSSVLKSMKRKYGQAEVVNSLHRIQQLLPQAFVGIDVIAGFPTESESDFEDTYRTLNELPWSQLHVFPYSERSGTLAASFQQIEYSKRKHRARRLRELSAQRNRKVAQEQIGQTKNVLMLNKKHVGLSRDYWHVHIEASDLAAGGEQQVRITETLESGQGSLHLKGQLQ